VAAESADPVEADTVVEGKTWAENLAFCWIAMRCVALPTQIPLFALPGQKWSNSEANTRWHEAFPNEARESVHAMLDDAALQRSIVTHLQYDLQKSYETNDKLRRRIASYEAAETS
jgi:hypothetical protein